MKYKTLIAFFAIALLLILQPTFNKQAKFEQRDEIQNSVMADKNGFMFDKNAIVPAAQRIVEF